MPDCTTNLRAIQSQMAAFFTVFATKVAVDVGGRQWTFLPTPSLLQYRDIFVPMHSNSPFFPELRSVFTSPPHVAEKYFEWFLSKSRQISTFFVLGFCLVS